MIADVDKYYERLGACFSNTILGVGLYQLFVDEKIIPVHWEELTDEQFTVLSFDLDLSDYKISKMFDVSINKIRKRRFDLEIPRGNARFKQWVDTDRRIVNINDFAKTISV